MPWPASPCCAGGCGVQPGRTWRRFSSRSHCRFQPYRPLRSLCRINWCTVRFMVYSGGLCCARSRAHSGQASNPGRRLEQSLSRSPTAFQMSGISLSCRAARQRLWILLLTASQLRSSWGLRGRGVECLPRDPRATPRRPSPNGSRDARSCFSARDEARSDCISAARGGEERV